MRQSYRGIGRCAKRNGSLVKTDEVYPSSRGAAVVLGVVLAGDRRAESGGAMRRVGQARRRDTAEKGIRAALEALGCDVTPLSGKGAPDLLVRVPGASGGRCIGLEVKSKGGRRTEAQEETNWPIVRTVGDALAAVGVTITANSIALGRCP
jgi:hypothetical protein